VLTPVERVLILKGADLLSDLGPRQLLRLAEVAREVEIERDERIYGENDLADAMYLVVEGRVRLSAGDRSFSEVGPGEAFGSWALVDGSERGQRAECVEPGVLLALTREEFYDVAAGDLAVLQQVVRALARRLRALAERPEEERVEREGLEAPDAAKEPAIAEVPAPASAGATLAAAAVGEPAPSAAPAVPSDSAVPDEPVPLPEPVTPGEVDEASHPTEE
jgi:signal-transduction protein with cAMP-binding, CBS, and nucleotidyltransferase domain